VAESFESNYVNRSVQPESLSWQSDALCAQTDPDLFVSGDGVDPEIKKQRIIEAKKICGYCEVAKDCLHYALENPDNKGVYGGLSDRERRKLLKKPYKTASTFLAIQALNRQLE